MKMIMEGLQKMVIPSLLHTLLDVKCEVVRDGLVIRDLSGRSALLISAARLEPKCFAMLLGVGASAKVRTRFPPRSISLPLSPLPAYLLFAILFASTIPLKHTNKGL
jgi:hypothetical protein